MKKYLIVLVRENDVWYMENGFYSKDDAEAEKECLRDHHKAKDIKIVSVADNQNAIESAIKTLNEGV